MANTDAITPGYFDRQLEELHEEFFTIIGPAQALQNGISPIKKTRRMLLHRGRWRSKVEALPLGWRKGVQETGKEIGQFI